jgi:hypothetical protein
MNDSHFSNRSRSMRSETSKNLDPKYESSEETNVLLLMNDLSTSYERMREKQHRPYLLSPMNFILAVCLSRFANWSRWREKPSIPLPELVQMGNGYLHARKRKWEVFESRSWILDTLRVSPDAVEGCVREGANDETTVDIEDKATSDTTTSPNTPAVEVEVRYFWVQTLQYKYQ